MGGYVAHFNQEQLPRAPLQHVRIYKIRIFRNHNSLFRYGNLADNRIFRVIACRKIQRVRCIMPMFCEKSTEAAWEVGIEEKFHVKAR